MEILGIEIGDAVRGAGEPGSNAGEEGLEKLKTNNYDVIFLDVIMPGVDGYNVCKIIRKSPKTKHIPIVMLTSKSSPFDKIRGSLAGCNNYLTKPVDYENFYQVLENYLALSRKNMQKSLLALTF